MKIYRIKYFLILFLINSSLLVCQETLQEQYQYSLDLFNNQKYFDAVTELKRLNFFDKTKYYAYQSNLLIGEAYKEGGKFSDALRYFRLAEINAANDSNRFDAKIFSVRVNILRRTTDQAIRVLDQIQSDAKFTSRKNEIYYWRGWAYIFANNWQSASGEFSKIDVDHPLKTLCDKTYAEMYNVTSAKVLSYIIPGAGQFFMSHYLSGLLSLGWNALWGYLTVKSFVDQRIFDGFAIGNFLWLRFYVGNIQNADKFANEENIAIANKALIYLQQEYQGEKP